ncbi:hypothetical protein [Sorangium sp. So ce131]|uniref:hypothetical protein n=1 Tax=Sorangium sp. So ce131 TaxID=3133282 RepID=UPI003F625847
MIGFPHKKWNPGFNLDFHSGIFMTPAGVPDPAVTMGLHVGVVLFATPWVGLGSSKGNSDRIRADGMPIVSRGHEVKYTILPHINVMPPPPGHINVLGTMLVLGSSSKCQFAASKVQCTDGPVAISVLRYVGINSACADPCTMPTSLVINWGTVNVGFTKGDLAAGALLFALEALKSYIEDKVFGALMGSKLTKKLLGSLMLRLFRKAGGDKVLGALAEEIVKSTLKIIYGETFGGKLGDVAKEKFFNDQSALGEWLTDPAGKGMNKAADGLAAWVDSMAEPVPQGGK